MEKLDLHCSQRPILQTTKRKEDDETVEADNNDKSKLLRILWMDLIHLALVMSTSEIPRSRIQSERFLAKLPICRTLGVEGAAALIIRRAVKATFLRAAGALAKAMALVASGVIRIMVLVWL